MVERFTLITPKSRKILTRGKLKNQKFLVLGTFDFVFGAIYECYAIILAGYSIFRTYYNIIYFLVPPEDHWRTFNIFAL